MEDADSWHGDVWHVPQLEGSSIAELTCPSSTGGANYSQVVRILKALLRRLTGSDIRALRAEVAELKATHAQIAEVVMNLNHDIRSGSEASLPLFLGYLDRLRLDADTAVAAAETIERQLAELRELSERRPRG